MPCKGEGGEGRRRRDQKRGSGTKGGGRTSLIYIPEKVQNVSSSASSTVKKQGGYGRGEKRITTLEEDAIIAKQCWQRRKEGEERSGGNQYPRAIANSQGQLKGGRKGGRSISCPRGKEGEEAKKRTSERVEPNVREEGGKFRRGEGTILLVSRRERGKGEKSVKVTGKRGREWYTIVEKEKGNLNDWTLRSRRCRVTTKGTGRIKTEKEPLAC